MLTLDYANTLATRVNDQGLDPSSLEPYAPSASRAAEITQSLAATRGTGWERWRDLPFPPMRDHHLEAVLEVSEMCKGRFDNLVVLGIGGSALGNIALQSALNPPTWNLLPSDGGAGSQPASSPPTPHRNGAPRTFIIDNVDPAHLGAHLDFIRATDPKLERTLFNVISKSGETAETAAQFMTIRALLIDALGKDEHADHIVAITDPAKGTMRSICDANGYATLPVPEGVGGRFSVLSPVGLFSAAMTGIDIKALLTGAAEMDDRCTNEDITQNPAAMLATILVRLARERNKTNHVMMPYANNLYLLADWFRQLWAESLGKRHDTDGNEVFAGYTPIKALGATDQHSQVQLYREGPNDKAFILMQVDDFAPHNDLAIPTGLDMEPLAYLEGKTFANLLNAEKRATEFALVESHRPNLTIRWPKVDAHHVGQFIQLWQVTTAYVGRMLGIDAYDQPAVETGKLATFGLMGRTGYQDWQTKVNKALPDTSKVI